MKRNTLFYVLCMAAIVGILAPSCTKLDVKDYSEIVKDNFNPQGSDVAALVAPVYVVMRPMWAGWMGNFDLQEESSDEFVTPVRPNGWYDGGTYIRMHQHTWTPNDWQPENLWRNCYSGINASNRVISQIEDGEIPIETGKENLVAELKAARAYYYYYLLDNFGRVPIVTDFKSTEVPQQSTRQQVYDFVVKELTDNIALLSEEVGQITYGRFNKWAAMTVLAKVYLNAEVYTGTQKWNECLAVCNQIISGTQSKYALEDDYKSNFITQNQNSKEIIFAVPYDETLATGFIIHMKTLKPVDQKVYSLQAQPWGGSCATPQFIKTYDKDDSRLENTWIMGPQHDPAGNVVIDYIDSLINIDQAGGNPFNYGFPFGKYEIKTGAKGNLSNDYVVFRYADVLMMKAECLLRIGNPGDAAVIVSAVRARNFKNAPSKATVTGSQLQQGSVYNYGYVKDGKIVTPEGGADIQYGRFFDELGWEFAGEAHRRQDMIRFGVYTTKTWLQHKPVGDYAELFPIAESILNSNPNLTQNTGY